MIPDNIFAYTSADEQFPEFVSVNRLADGDVQIIVRSPAKMHASGEYLDAGDCAQATMPAAEWAKLTQAG